MVLPVSPVLPPGASRGRRAPLTIPACLRLNGCFRKSSTAGAGKKNSLRSNSFFPDRPVCTVFPGRSESAQVGVPTSGPQYFLGSFKAMQCKSQAFSLLQAGRLRSQLDATGRRCYGQISAHDYQLAPLTCRL